MSNPTPRHQLTTAVATGSKIVCNPAANVRGHETLRATSRMAGRAHASWRTAGLSLRAVISAFVLLAFALSGFATQTHIHVPFESGLDFGAQQIAAKNVAGASSLNREHKPSTPADDPSRCPLCQEYLHSGAYVTPIPAVFPLPILTATVAPFLIASKAIVRAVSHDWHGRAPPLA